MKLQFHTIETTNFQGCWSVAW